MSWSNCLLFAVRLYIRLARKGDRRYIVIRKSRLGMGVAFPVLAPPAKADFVRAGRSESEAITAAIV
jgi:hypothetical protein